MDVTDVVRRDSKIFHKSKDVQTSLNLLMRTQKFISPNVDVDLDGNRFSKWLKASQGKMSGKSWEGGKTPGGRFCNVFKFRDGRISSLHVYLDADYTGEDEARFRWGLNRQW